LPLALLAVLLALPGCRGCHSETAEEAEKREAEERAKKEKEKPKEDFEYGGPAAWPCGRYSITEGSRLGPSNWLKPGHWTSIVLANAKMNNFDFLGDWDLTLVDRTNDAHGPVPLPATPYTLTTSRQVALPKGQAKTLESLLLVPPDHQPVSLNYQLRGRRLFEAGQPLALMPSYQYHIVVLSRWPARYTYLDELPSVKPETNSIASTAHSPHYRITLSPPKGSPPLPAHALLWTSIAYVLWDDADPATLDADQRQAMLDWLHWGGQLILSGPDTLEELRGSFLEPYLPATSAGARDLHAGDLAELSQQWSGATGRDLTPVQPWAGVRLKKDARAQFLPDTGDLLVERAVGRGRIVVSAFRLSGPELISWPGWDSVFNACLLRRPPRFFTTDPEKDPVVRWSDERAHPNPWDPAINSRLRFFARDEGVALPKYAAPADLGNVAVANGWRYRGNVPGPGGDPVEGEADLSGVMVPAKPGVAAWNDFSPIANAARQGLQQAAGIKVLDRMFVVWIMVGYVLVLVPLNWTVFRWLGRVEWAWAAAPLIAIVCAAVVINLAQLDIGFVRAQNEIGVVELQGDFPRAHVTRYAALYTSLSTGYAFHFDSPGSMMLPFSTTSEPGSFHMLLGESYRDLTCRRGSNIDIAGYAVGSNSIGFIHGEQWIDLAHPLVVSKQDEEVIQIANQTQFTLRDAGVIKKTAGGGLQTAWLGTIPAGAAASGQFDLESTTSAGGELWKDKRNRAPQTAAGAASGELNLRELINIAQTAGDMRPGQVRLVAWMDDELPGLVIEPAAKQSRHVALVVAHLAAGEDEMPRPDANAMPPRPASSGDLDQSSYLPPPAPR
jgi:hypothetical protein